MLIVEVVVPELVQNGRSNASQAQLLEEQSMGCMSTPGVYYDPSAHENRPDKREVSEVVKDLGLKNPDKLDDVAYNIKVSGNEITFVTKNPISEYNIDYAFNTSDGSGYSWGGSKTQVSENTSRIITDSSDRYHGEMIRYADGKCGFTIRFADNISKVRFDLGDKQVLLDVDQGRPKLPEPQSLPPTTPANPNTPTTPEITGSSSPSNPDQATSPTKPNGSDFDLPIDQVKPLENSNQSADPKAENFDLPIDQNKSLPGEHQEGLGQGILTRTGLDEVGSSPLATKEAQKLVLGTFAREALDAAPTAVTSKVLKDSLAKKSNGNETSPSTAQKSKVELEVEKQKLAFTKVEISQDTPPAEIKKSYQALEKGEKAFNKAIEAERRVLLTELKKLDISNPDFTAKEARLTQLKTDQANYTLKKMKFAEALSESGKPKLVKFGEQQLLKLRPEIEKALAVKNLPTDQVTIKLDEITTRRQTFAGKLIERGKNALAEQGKSAYAKSPKVVQQAVDLGARGASSVRNGVANLSQADLSPRAIARSASDYVKLQNMQRSVTHTESLLSKDMPETFKSSDIKAITKLDTKLAEYDKFLKIQQASGAEVARVADIDATRTKVQELRSSLGIRRVDILEDAISKAETPQARVKLEKALYGSHVAEAESALNSHPDKTRLASFQATREAYLETQKISALRNEVEKSKPIQAVSKEIAKAEGVKSTLKDPDLIKVHDTNIDRLKSERQVLRREALVERMKSAGDFSPSRIQAEEARLTNLEATRNVRAENLVVSAAEAKDNIPLSSEQQSSLSKMQADAIEADRIRHSKNATAKGLESAKPFYEEVNALEKQKAFLESELSEKANEARFRDIQEALNKTNKDIAEATRTALREELEGLKTAQETFQTEINNLDEQLKTTALSPDEAKPFIEGKAQLELELKEIEQKLKDPSLLASDRDELIRTKTSTAEDIRTLSSKIDEMALGEGERQVISQSKANIESQLDGVKAAKEYVEGRISIADKKLLLAEEKQKVIELEKRIDHPKISEDAKIKHREALATSKKLIATAEAELLRAEKSFSTSMKNNLQTLWQKSHHTLYESKWAKNNPMKATLAAGALVEIAERTLTADYSEEGRHTAMPRLFMLLSTKPENLQFSTKDYGTLAAISANSVSAAGDFGLAIGGISAFGKGVSYIPGVTKLSSSLTNAVAARALIGVGSAYHAYSNFSQGQFKDANDLQLFGMTGAPVGGIMVATAAGGPIGLAVGAVGVMAVEAGAVGIGLARLDAKMEKNLKLMEANDCLNLAEKGFVYNDSHPKIAEHRAEYNRNPVAKEAVVERARMRALALAFTELSGDELLALGFKTIPQDASPEQVSEINNANWEKVEHLTKDEWFHENASEYEARGIKVGGMFGEAMVSGGKHFREIYESSEFHFQEQYIRGMHVSYENVNNLSGLGAWSQELFGRSRLETKRGYSETQGAITRTSEIHDFAKEIESNLASYSNDHPEASAEDLSKYLADAFGKVTTYSINEEGKKEAHSISGFDKIIADALPSSQGTSAELFANAFSADTKAGQAMIEALRSRYEPGAVFQEKGAQLANLYEAN